MSETGLIHNHMLGEKGSSTDESKYQDYVGFIFNDIHSSDLGIVRTSDGSRFNENLLPTIQDKTVQVPGGDGTYFFGSYYTQKQFTIPFAFNALTEEKFLKLKTWLGDKKVHDLIFDEAPYKVYKAKVTGSATIKHIPFMEKDPNSEDDKEVRIYKGEGSIQFTCYQPFARSRFKTLEKYEEEGYENVKEWVAASGILKANHEANEEEGTLAYSDFDNPGAGPISLYNPGCIDSHFKLRIDFIDGKIGAGGVRLDNDSLNWKEFELKGNDTYVVIDTKMNLIEGHDADNKKTGKIYNEYITSGTFFKIPVGQSTMELTTITASAIDYDYYYL